MPWQEIEAQLAHRFLRKARTDVAMPDLDLFGERAVRKGTTSRAGRPRIPFRIMVSLLYLKHAFNESDEGVVQRWAETPTWQYFSGQVYVEHSQPCDATTLVKCRRLLKVASTLHGNLRVGAHAFHHNPYDGHTLTTQLAQTRRLTQNCAGAPDFVDLGYRGIDADNPEVCVVHRGKLKRLSAREKKQFKRRQAIEAIIGHLEADHRMKRCLLKGECGDPLHAVLWAAGYTIKWLLRMMVKKGVPCLRVLFFAPVFLHLVYHRNGWKFN